MKEYTVMWEIDVSASDPYEAAALARKMQLDPNSTATVFNVSEDAPSVEVDVLLEDRWNE
jgi:hypothetical protein